jgi:type VI secretion system protein ImpF
VSRKSVPPSLLPSLLDRLTDHEPNIVGEPPATRSQSLRELKNNLRRDLEWLLNTRRNPTAIPEGARQLTRSVFAYGLPDISGMSLNSERDRAALLNIIEDAVIAFEPRLANVTVTLVPTETHARVLRFQIEGMLRMEPAPERVSFDTTLRLASATYEVEAERRAG